MTLTDYRNALADQLRTIPGVRVYTDVGASVNPPGVIVNVPSLSWQGMGPEPTSATFTVVYAVRMSDRAADELVSAVSAVSEAVTDPDFSIDSAQPGVWNSDGVDLPAYSFSISVAL